MHRYFVDNTVHIREGDKIVKYLIEIKPHKQTKPPTKHGNKKQQTVLYENATWSVNQAKWAAAVEWCKKNNYKFQIVTFIMTLNLTFKVKLLCQRSLSHIM